MAFVDRVPKAPEVRGAPVGDSSDLQRILALPRRTLDLNDPRAAIAWTDHLRRERTTPCDCVARWGFCITSLRPVQGWALEEASDAGGLLASVGVGDGKTGIDLLLPMAIPDVKTAVLLIPSGLRHQLLNKDYPQWSAHFKLPNLAGVSPFVPGRPVILVVTYNELSLKKNTDLFQRFDPDLIVCDESQNLADKKSVRTGRFLDIWVQRKKRGRAYPSAAFLSGTMTTKSIEQYAHQAGLALREGSPVPLSPPVVSEWASVLDASDFVAPTGELRKLCEGGDSPRDGFRKRLVSTAGVVATAASRLGVSLLISKREPPPLPKAVADALGIAVGEDAQRPDGEELIEALEVSMVARQLACGFFYRWKFVNGETYEQIERWRKRRKEYRREARQQLFRTVPFLDSPLLLKEAAHRWHFGYKVTEADGVVREIAPYTRRGPLPVWESEFFLPWHEVDGTVKPETEAVWIDKWLVYDAAAWVQEAPGIAWYKHDAFGTEVATVSGAKLYGGGALASREILEENGDRSIVASIKAHGTGKNLQIAFGRNLFTNPEGDNGEWEQGIGRTHRTGQPRDEVTVEVYQHTPHMVDALQTARNRARYVEETTGSAQRLCYATYSF